MNRRNFSSLLSSSLLGLTYLDALRINNINAKKYKISLAQWSINGSISKGDISPIDFAKKARELEIDAIEHVNTLYSVNSDYLSKNSMKTLIKDLNSRADDYGVKNLLIMISQEGELASNNKKSRAKAIDQHKAWIDVANEIGCESVRVDLRGGNSFNQWKQNIQEKIGYYEFEIPNENSKLKLFLEVMVLKILYLIIAELVMKEIY